jgi:hypothetical protein
VTLTCPSTNNRYHLPKVSLSNNLPRASLLISLTMRDSQSLLLSRLQQFHCAVITSLPHHGPREQVSKTNPSGTQVTKSLPQGVQSMHPTYLMVYHYLATQHLLLVNLSICANHSWLRTDNPSIPLHI